MLSARESKTSSPVAWNVAAEIVSPNPAELERAARLLRAGEVVAMPTETVYGLAAVVFNETALARVFAVKERPTFDPLICHVAVPEDASVGWLSYLAAQQLVDVERLADDARQAVERLTFAFWPGPLTLVLPKQPAVPDLATSGLPTVAIRAPRHPVAQALLRAVGLPLAAPSANRFGRISPTAAEHVMAELGDRIPLILDGGPCQIGIESTVLLVEPEGTLRLLRPGGVTQDEIEGATGQTLTTAEGLAGGTPLPSPGLMASHYAPRKPLELLPKPLGEFSDEELKALVVALPADVHVGVLLAQGDAMAAQARLLAAAEETGRATQFHVISLSPNGDATEAARGLFQSLRSLDARDDVTLLWAELCAGEGLAHAINDRLRKASGSRGT